MSVLSPIAAQWRMFWQARAPREQVLLITAVIVLTVGSLLGAVIIPAHEGIKKLNVSLPDLQAQAAQVSQLAAQVKANPKPLGSNRTSTAATVQASLNSIGISAKISPAAPWTITVESAAGEPLFQLLKANPAAKAQLKRLPSGAWQGEIVLES